MPRIMVKKRQRRSSKQESQELKMVTRRQFLKEASIIAGGAAVTLLTITSACSTPEDTTTTGITTTTGTTTIDTTTTTMPNTITATPTTTPTTTITPTEIPTSTSTDNFIYVPSVEGMEILPIPGCTTSVASDRMYTVEHMWVKYIADDKVAVGITDKMQELMDFIFKLRLPEEGEKVIRGETFGYGEGSKLAVEFFTPISGQVLQVNKSMWDNLDNAGNHILNLDPYVKGWIVVLQMSNPEELDELLSAQEYIDLNAKISD